MHEIIDAAKAFVHALQRDSMYGYGQDNVVNPALEAAS
jgi:hypothetical protein